VLENIAHKKTKAIKARITPEIAVDMFAQTRVNVGGELVIEFHVRYVQ